MGRFTEPPSSAKKETQLAPTLKPADVVNLDNLSSHKSLMTSQGLKDKGAEFLFLPTFTPALNPVEMAFAKLKALLRKIEPRTFAAPWQALGDISCLFVRPRMLKLLQRC